MLEILTLSTAELEKLFASASSSSLDLNTQLAAPVIATLTSFFNCVTYTPTIAYLDDYISIMFLYQKFDLLQNILIDYFFEK